MFLIVLFCFTFLRYVQLPLFIIPCSIFSYSFSSSANFPGVLPENDILHIEDRVSKWSKYYCVQNFLFFNILLLIYLDIRFWVYYLQNFEEIIPWSSDIHWCQSNSHPFIATCFSVFFFSPKGFRIFFVLWDLNFTRLYLKVVLGFCLVFIFIFIKHTWHLIDLFI